MDQTVAAAWHVLQHPHDHDPLDVALACETVKAFSDARQLGAFTDLAATADIGTDPLGSDVDPTAAEIGCALHWPASTASHRLDLAITLHHELPHVLAALAAGTIDLAAARELAQRTTTLPPDARAALTTRGIGYASGHTRAQLGRWLLYHVDRIDPEAAQRRRAAARTRRGVWLHDEPDGMATLSAYLTAAEGKTCIDHIRAHLGATNGALHAGMADAFIHLLTGIRPDQPIPVTVILPPHGTGAEPEIAGYGPISEDHAAELVNDGVTEVIDLTTPPPPATGYRPAPRLQAYVRTRDRHCRFPGCRRRATRCDLDHTTPWPAGPTSHQNLHALCRYHHRLKTHTRWTVTTGPNHTLTWTSPRGHTYQTHLTDP